MNFGLRAALTIIEILAMFSRSLPAAERHTHFLEKEAGLFVIFRARDDGDVHSLRLVDLRDVDLREDEVVLDAEGVVAAAVERLGRHAAEVADARQCQVDQTVEEL